MSFTVGTYNILHPVFAVRHNQKQGLVCDVGGNPVQPPQDNWKIRSVDLVSNVKSANPDILNVEEISKTNFDQLNNEFQKLGYEGVHLDHQANEDGVAVFYKTKRFKPIQVRDHHFAKDNRAHKIVDLEDVATKEVTRNVVTHFRGGANPDQHPEGIEHAKQVLVDLNAISTQGVARVILSADFNTPNLQHEKLSTFLNDGFHTDGSDEATSENNQGNKKCLDRNLVKNIDGSKPVLKHITLTSQVEAASDHFLTVTEIATSAIAQIPPVPAPQPPAAPPAPPVKTTLNVLTRIISDYDAKNSIFEAPDSSGTIAQTIQPNLSLQKNERSARWANRERTCLDIINKELAKVEVKGTLIQKIGQTQHLIHNMKVFNRLANDHLTRTWVRICRFVVRLFTLSFVASRYACKTLDKEIQAHEASLQQLEVEFAKKREDVHKQLNDGAIYTALMRQDALKDGFPCNMSSLEITAATNEVDELYVSFAENRQIVGHAEPRVAAAVLIKYLQNKQAHIGIQMYRMEAAFDKQNKVSVSDFTTANQTNSPENQEFLKTFIQLLNTTYEEYRKHPKNTLMGMLEKIPNNAKMLFSNEQLAYFMENYKNLFEPAEPKKKTWTQKALALIGY